MGRIARPHQVSTCEGAQLDLSATAANDGVEWWVPFEESVPIGWDW